MKTFKTKGLPYFVTCCDNVNQAVITLIKNKIGVTEKNLIEWDKSIPMAVTIFSYSEPASREQAIEWWNKQPKVRRQELYFGYFGCNIENGQWEDEIEEIWKKETQQVLDILDTVDLDYAESFERTNKLVDFEMLKDSIPMVEACVDNYKPAWNNKIDNLKLFFDKLSTSSSFAHKAHKELNRLNQ